MKILFKKNLLKIIISFVIISVIIVSVLHIGATAICRDGSYSYSQNHRGTCSYHGGVSKWL